MMRDIGLVGLFLAEQGLATTREHAMGNPFPFTRRYLTAEQHAVLESLPPLTASLDAAITGYVALAELSPPGQAAGRTDRRRLARRLRARERRLLRAQYRHCAEDLTHATAGAPNHARCRAQPESQDAGRGTGASVLPACGLSRTHRQIARVLARRACRARRRRYPCWSWGPLRDATSSRPRTSICSPSSAARATKLRSPRTLVGNG